MIDTDKYEGRTLGQWSVTSIRDGSIPYNTADEELCADAPLLLADYKRLRDGIRSILSDYDITELIRDVPQDEWNFEQQALIRMKEMTE